MTPQPEFLADEATLDALLAGFEDGTWTKEQWTHAAHLATDSGYHETLNVF